MKLTVKILALMVAVVVLVTFLAGTFSVRLAYSNLEERQQRVTEQLAEEIEGRLAVAWRQGGPAGVDRALHDWVERTNQPLLLEFVLFQSSHDIDRQFVPRVARELWPVLRRGQIFSRVSVGDDGSRSLHTYLPIENWDGELGALELTQPLSALDEQTRQLVWGIVLAMAASALVGVGIAYAAGVRWVARPLTQLIAQTEQIGRGDLTARINLHTGDELDKLAQALNAMSQHLADQQNRIEHETEQRVKTLEQLRHADRLGTLGRMAAGLAHELGTPLNVVAGRAALIASGRLSAEEVTSSAGTIKQEADRITNIVQRMLDFARQRRPQTMQCDLVELVRHTLHLVQPLAEKKAIELRFDNATDQSAQVEIDPAQIQQVLTNLIVNAIQATPAHGQVRLSIATSDSSVYCVDVEDSGPGVPAEIRERIFEPFFTTKDVGEGTGLGLSIAYGIVQEHGGSISVMESSLGGAHFRFCLPKTKSASK